MKEAVLTLLVLMTVVVIFLSASNLPIDIQFIVGMGLVTFWSFGWPKIARRLP